MTQMFNLTGRAIIMEKGKNSMVIVSEYVYHDTYKLKQNWRKSRGAQTEFKQTVMVFHR